VTSNRAVRQMEERIRKLERRLGRKTLEVEILKEALDNPAGHPARWPSLLEALDRVPRSQPDRGKDAMPHIFRRAHRRLRP